MRRVRMRGGVLIAIHLVALASVQAQNHDRDRIQLAVKNPSCQPGAQVSCGADMELVRAALKSPTALWVFITSPDTGYFERLTAASDAGKLMPATWIQKCFQLRTNSRKKKIFIPSAFSDIP
jgi:hypothetical protein